eukprot:jgi/Tetstr1/441559/TSEL_029788.t1
MHLAYDATFDPSVYVRCAPRAGCPGSGHHVFHGAQAAARAATCEFCSPTPPAAPPPGVALPASAAGVRAMQRQHAPDASSAAQDAAVAATARWCATSDVYRKMPQAAEGGADAAADGVPPAVVDAHRRAAKLTAVHELRRARHALDTADLGMVSDAAAALPVLEALHPPPAPTDPEYSSPEEPPDLRRAAPSWGGNVDEARRWGEDQRRVLRRAPRFSAGHVDWWREEHIGDLDVPSWRLWVNRCLAGRCHSRTTAAFLASGTVFALHKDDPAAREKRAKIGEPLRVRPLGVGSVLVRLASAHALVHVGADAREAMGPYNAAFSRELATGFLSRLMPPSELNPFLEAVDAANISAALSLLGLDDCA